VRRYDDGQMRWLAIELPEVIALRERFLSPDTRCRHLACNATDLRWTVAVDAVDAAAPV
jgi:O-methyltransferase involved in polyketide biosynthesis